MLAIEFMKICEAYVGSQVGEEIEFQTYPSGSWQIITVPVDRQPVDAFGAGLQGKINVLLPKELVETIHLKQDKIRLAPVAVGEAQRTYTLMAILPQGNQPGHFWVECSE